MLQYCLRAFAVFDINDVSFWHDVRWLFICHIFGVFLHVAVKLTFCGNLVDAVNMVIDLMR